MRNSAHSFEACNLFYLIFFKQTPANILIKIVGEGLSKKAESSLEDVALVRGFDGYDVEINEPGQ